MLFVFAALVSVFIVACSVGSIVTVLRYPLPRTDRETVTQATRAVNRGSMPTGEPARAAAVQIAQNRARLYWSVLASVGLGAMMLLLFFGLETPIPMFVPVAVAAILFVAAVLETFLLVNARRALGSISG